ncbi:hypothetical protein ACJX0J_030309 [Zea mays]
MRVDGSPIGSMKALHLFNLYTSFMNTLFTGLFALALSDAFVLIDIPSDFLNNIISVYMKADTNLSWHNMVSLTSKFDLLIAYHIFFITNILILQFCSASIKTTTLIMLILLCHVRLNMAKHLFFNQLLQFSLEYNSTVCNLKWERKQDGGGTKIMKYYCQAAHETYKYENIKHLTILALCLEY